jgi:tetratricopeptide (TPR) repeat protein
VIFTNSKILSDKVNLIYSLNKNSALFVRAASYQIENNNVSGAIEILNKGLKNYPDHPAAYFLLGKAYIILGNYNLAEEFIRKGCNFIQSEETYEYYLAEISKIRNQRTIFNVTREKLFPKPLNAESDKNWGEGEAGKNDLNKPKDVTNRVDERFEQLVQSVSTAKKSFGENNLSANTEPGENKTGLSSLVSETLANIYQAQGEFNEAINVYEKLIKQNPDKQEYYSNKIEEIRSASAHRSN